MKKLWKQIQRNMFFKMILVAILLAVLIQVNINRISRDDVIEAGREVKSIIEEIQEK